MPPVFKVNKEILHSSSWAPRMRLRMLQNNRKILRTGSSWRKGKDGGGNLLLILCDLFIYFLGKWYHIFISSFPTEFSVSVLSNGFFFFLHLSFLLFLFFGSLFILPFLPAVFLSFLSFSFPQYSYFSFLNIHPCGHSCIKQAEDTIQVSHHCQTLSKSEAWSEEEPLECFVLVTQEIS